MASRPGDSRELRLHAQTSLPTPKTAWKGNANGVEILNQRRVSRGRIPLRGCPLETAGFWMRKALAYAQAWDFVASQLEAAGAIDLGDEVP